MNFFNGIGNFFSSIFDGNKDDEEKKRREREAQARERQQKQAEQSQKQQQRQQPQQQNKNVFGGNIQNSLQINTGFINEQKKKDTPLIEVKPSVTTENDNTLAKKLEENKKKQEQAKQSSANSPKFGYNNTQKAFEIDFKKQQADNNKSRDDARRVRANIIAKDTAEKQGDRFGADEQSKRRDSELRKRTNDIYEKTLYNELKNANSFEGNFGRDQIKERAYNLARSQAMKEQGNNDETLAKQLNDQMLKSKRQVEDSRDRVQIMENARGQAIDTYKLGAEGISTGAGKALYGEDDNPDKLDMKDVARFLVNLPGGMASAPISAITKIAEVASGSELKKKGPNYDDDYERVALTPAQMAGRTASGLTDLFGLELGGSGKLMGSLGLKAAQKSGEQIAKTGVRQVAKNILTDGLKEGGEEAFQSIADDLSERGGFDEDTLKRALESFGWGVAGGGVMSGAGSGVDAVKGKINTKTDIGELQAQTNPKEKKKDNVLETTNDPDIQRVVAEYKKDTNQDTKVENVSQDISNIYNQNETAPVFNPNEGSPLNDQFIRTIETINDPMAKNIVDAYKGTEASPAVRNTVIDNQGNTVDTNTGEILDLPTVEPTNTVDTNEIAPNTSQDVAGDTQSRNPNAMSNILTEDYIAQMRERANKTQDADLSLNKELPMDYSSQAIAQRLQGAGITQDNINTLAKAGYGRSEIIAALNGSNDLNGANNPVALLRSIMDKNRKATNPTSAALNNNITQKRLAGENNQDIAQQIIQELTGETTETFGSKAPANIDPNAKPYSGEMFGVDKNKGVIRVIDRDFRLPEAGVPITQETFINDYLADITEYIKDEVQLPSETMLENITGSDYASFREAIFKHTENNQSLDENVKSTYDELFRDSYKDLLEIARSSGRDIGELDYYLDPNKSVVDIANPDMAITSLVDTGFTEARTGSQFIDPETGEFSMDRVSSDAGVQDYAQKVIASLYETELQAGEKMKRNPNMTPENAIKSVKETKKMVDDITKISKDPKLAKDTVTAEDIYSKQTGFNILDKARQVGEMENNPVTVVQSKLGATKKALTTVQDVFTNVVFTRTLKDGTTLDTNLYDTGFKQYARAEQYSLVALNKFKESGVLEYASYDVANNIKNMFPNMSDADVDTLVNRAERNIGFAITDSSFTDVELETKIRNEYSKVYKQAAKLELFDMAKTTEFKDKRLKNMVNKQISNTLSHDVSLDGTMGQVLKLARGLQYSSKLGLNVSSALQQLLEIKRIAINDGVIDAGKSVAGAFTNRGENKGIANFDNDMSRLSYDGDLTNRKGTLGLLNEGVDILNSKVMLKPFETAENFKNDVFVDQAVRDGKAQGLEGIALTDYVMDYVDKNALTGGYGKQIGLTDGEVGRNAFMFQSFAIRSTSWDIDKFADLMRDPKNGQNWAKIARLIGVNGAIIVASSLALNKGADWATGIMGDMFNITGDNYTDVDDEDMSTMDNFINHLPNSPMTQPIIDLYFNIRSEQIGAEDENREFNLGNVFNAESAKDFVLDFVPGSSQAGKTLAFSDEQAKGYAENKDGRIQRETPSDLWNTILGYTLGKNSTDKAKEYFDRPDYAEGFEQGGISGVVKEMSKDQAFDPIRTIFGLDNPREQERPLQAKYNADDPDNYNEVAKRAIEEVGVKYDVGSPQYKQAVKDWVELGRDYNHLKDNFRKNPEKYAKYEETYNEDTISQRKWAIIHEDKDVYDYMKKKALLEERDLGREIDPIYHLDDGKAAMVIQKDGVFTGDDTKLNRDLYQTDWYDDFMNQRTAYYEQMGEFDNSGKTPRVQEWNGLRDQLNNIKQNDERYDILRQESQLYEEFGKGSPEVKDFYNNINYDALQELKNQKAVEELEIINRMRAIEGADPLSIEVYKSKTIYGDDSSSGKSYGKSGSGGSGSSSKGSSGSGSSSKGSSGFTSHINLLGLGKEAPKFKTKTVKFKPNTSAGSRKKTKHSIGGRSKGSTS